MLILSRMNMQVSLREWDTYSGVFELIVDGDVQVARDL